MGVVAIAAFVVKIGLGDYGYYALDNLGSVNTKNEALVCVLFVILVALAFDAVFVVLADSPLRGEAVPENLTTSNESTHRGVPFILKELTKKYPNQPRPAVDAVNMEIPAGEIVVLVGPSGYGKTTTMRMVNRLIEQRPERSRSAARTCSR